MKLTATQQRNAVSEGTALGLVALGYDRVRFEKWRVDLAFAGAWRDWAYSRRFSQVDTDIRKGLDGANAMTRASEGKRTTSFYWVRERELTIYWRRSDFDPDSDDELAWATKMIDGEVPLEGWKSLAQGFLDRFQRPSTADESSVARPQIETN